MKKLISLLCVVALLVCCLPLSAQAWDYTRFDYPLAGGTLHCREYPNHITICGNLGLSGEVTIPETIRGKPVAELFFDSHPYDTPVVENALNSGAEKLILPASLTMLTYGVATYERGFLGGLNLKEIVFLGDGPEVLPSETFARCPALERVVLPKKVRKMDGAFFNMDTKNGGRLSEIVLDPANRNFTKDEQGIVYSGDKTRAVTAAENAGVRTEAVLPASVREIAVGAFAQEPLLERVTGMSGVTVIGDAAFAGDPALKSVGCLSQVTEIGYSAFAGDKSLETLEGLTLKASAKSDSFQDCDKLYPFVDTENHWAHETLRYAWEKEWLSGTRPNRMDPDGKIERGMITAMLYRMDENFPYEEPEREAWEKTGFSDVSPWDWQYFCKPVAWARQYDIVSGYPDGGFHPRTHVTREQLASILYRYAQKLGAAAGAGDLSAFTDSAKVSRYAREAMEWAVGAGVMSGKGNGKLDPKGTATRAEAASMLRRLEQCLQK